MKWFIAAFLFPIAAFAQNPTTGPAQKYFLGASIGEVWQQATGIAGGIRSVSGTTDTILCSDQGKTVFYTSGSAIAVTLPQANATTPSCFGPGFRFGVFAAGAGTVTVTPTTSTITGNQGSAASTAVFSTHTGGSIQSDGTNYWQN